MAEAEQSQRAAKERRARITACKKERRELRKQLKEDPKYRGMDDQARAKSIREERRKMERDFYWSRHGFKADGTPLTEQQRADTLRQSEIRWNAMKAEEARLGGDNSKWTYKQDRRVETQFSRGTKTGIDGKQYDYVNAESNVYSEATTIDWRADTAYGKSRAQSVQRSQSKGTGTVSAHLAPSWTGADPEGVNAGVAHPRRRLPPSERANLSQWTSEDNLSGVLGQDEKHYRQISRDPPTDAAKNGDEPCFKMRVHEPSRNADEQSRSLAPGRETTVTNSKGESVLTPDAKAANSRLNDRTLYPDRQSKSTQTAQAADSGGSKVKAKDAERGQPEARQQNRHGEQQAAHKQRRQQARPAKESTPDNPSQDKPKKVVPAQSKVPKSPEPHRGRKR